MENYFTIAAIQKVTNGNIPDGLVSLAPDKKVVDQLGFEVKNNGRKIIREMSADDLRGTDLEGFISEIERMLTTGDSKTR